MTNNAHPLQAILDRIPEEWGKSIPHIESWWPHLAELDANLAAIYPDYVVHQCKVKFGGLRYYTNIGDYRPNGQNGGSKRWNDHFDAVMFIREAEEESYKW